MSVINKMLQELDRRNAVASGGTEPGPQPVKPARAKRGGHEWFWRSLAVLVLVSLGWVGWVAYQLQPRTILTPLALKSAPAVPPKPKAEPKKAAEKPAEKKPAATPQPVGKTVVDKRERAKVNEAEAHFRRAAALLNQGRVSEAEEQLIGALQADSSHVPARQAYVALLLDHQRVEEALRLLREAVAVNPSQPTFSLALARIHAEHRDYKSALDVMDKSGASAEAADFQALRGAVLQRLGRHAEAVSAYRKAVEAAPQTGGTWTGLAISLEAIGRSTEASQAYQRALLAGPIAKELRDYAEARIKALQ